QERRAHRSVRGLQGRLSRPGRARTDRRGRDGLLLGGPAAVLAGRPWRRATAPDATAAAVSALPGQSPSVPRRLPGLAPPVRRLRLPAPEAPRLPRGTVRLTRARSADLPAVR